jgi:DNA-binding response OmpR family regulator
VWNLSFDTTTNIVDVYINYIRKPFTPDQMKQHVLPLLQK